MKDARFIELVNLYIDRQISAEEAAELEAEIQASPRRRQVYQQYCRMHRATKLVYESFRAHGEVPAQAGAQPASITAFAQHRRRAQRARWLYASAGLAAAAALALVFLRPNQAAPTAPEPAATVAVAPIAAKVQPAPAATVVVRPEFAAVTAASREDARPMVVSQPVSIRSVALFDDGVFDDRPIVTPDGRRIFLPKAKTDNRPNAEFTAFQFQR